MVNNMKSNSHTERPRADNALWVCWEEPTPLPDENATIVSFLRPGREDALRKNFKGTLISARENAPRVKEKARAIYINLIARIGATALGDGGTLRKVLENDDGVSLWWFHKVSERDCESDATFRLITEILIIRSVADSMKCKDMFLCGGCKEVAQVLGDLYLIKEIHCKRMYPSGCYIAKGALSRIKYFWQFLSKWMAVKRAVKSLPRNHFDAVFSGFWDWSVREEKETGRLNDRFFKSLPQKLAEKGLVTGWFLWFDPHREPGSATRSMRDVLMPVGRHDTMVILQRFITFTDVVQALINLKGLCVFLRFLRDKNFRGAFREEGINFLPILKVPLVHGFLNSSIPHQELVYRASKRAFMAYRPEVSISFLELFLHSRAFYCGGRKGSAGTVHCAVQHASYSREKTFAVLHPDSEYRGEPDSCPVPAPDYVFAMGDLGREIFIESGFPKEKVFLTGSPRYEHITQAGRYHRDKWGDVKNILMVTTLNVDLEMEMVDAVYAATEGLSGVKLFLRSHPFARMDEHPGFRIYKDRVRHTQGTLDENLKDADLIIFSYSTVAEEAIIAGLPAWQWCSTSYNGSVFRDIKVVPSFCSVRDLRESLKKFIEEPRSFMPDMETGQGVARKCFYAADGKASDRIADIVHGSMGLFFNSHTASVRAGSKEEVYSP